eukprot:gene1312-1901_t
MTVLVASEHTAITHSEDASALAPIEVPTSSRLSVTVRFSDGTCTDFTHDERTVYTVVHGASLARVLNATVVAEESGAGTATISVTFREYRAAQHLHKLVNISVFQRAAVRVSATLSNGKQYEVTRGSRIVSGQAKVLRVEAQNVLAPVSGGVALVTGVTFAGEKGAVQQLSVRMEFDDGTVFADVVQEVEWIPLWEMLRIESSSEEKIAIEGGRARLLHNHYTGIQLRYEVVCAGAEAAVTAEEWVYANLMPAVGDIDLGHVYGLQFPAAAEGEVVVVEMRVNAGTGRLVGFAVEVYIDACHMLARACKRGAGWVGGTWVCEMNAPPEVVSVEGRGAVEGAAGSGVHVATLELLVGDSSVLSLISGLVLEMTRDDNDMRGAAYGIFAGQGWAQLNAGNTSHFALNQTAERAFLPTSPALLTQGSLPAFGALQSVHRSASPPLQPPVPPPVGEVSYVAGPPPLLQRLRRLQRYEHSALAAAEDRAASRSLGLPSSTLLTVVVRFDDGSCSDFTHDPRTVYTVVQGGVVAEVRNATIRTLAGAGSVAVRVGFIEYPPAAALGALLRLKVIGVESITLSSEPYPRFPDSDVMPVTVLKRVQCTATWQRSVVRALARLSNGRIVDVTANSALSSSNASVLDVREGGIVVPAGDGVAEVIAAYGDLGHSIQLRVDGTMQTLPIEMEARTVWWEGRTFLGEWGASKRLAVRVVFDDGTELPDAVGGAEWISTPQLLRFESGVEAAVAVDVHGVATLLGNHHRAVELTVTAACPEAEGLQMPQSVEQVYANLEPSIGDVDLGQRWGLQFPAAAHGEVVAVEVRVNTGIGELLAVALDVGTNSTSLSVQSCAVGRDWDGAFECAAGDSGQAVHLEVAAARRPVRGDAAHLATIKMLVGDAAELALINGTVTTMLRSDDAEWADHPYAIFSGAGLVALNGGPQASRTFGSLVEGITSGVATYGLEHIMGPSPASSSQAQGVSVLAAAGITDDSHTNQTKVSRLAT